MKKRYFKPWIEFALVIIVACQFMLLSAEPSAQQMALYIPTQIVNICLLIVNIMLLDQFGRLIGGE